MFADPRSHSSRFPAEARLVEGWIHEVRSREVDVFFPETPPGEIVTTSIEYFLSLPIDLRPGTPVALANWEEQGTPVFQVREPAS